MKLGATRVEGIEQDRKIDSVFYGCKSPLKCFSPRHRTDKGKTQVSLACASPVLT